MNWYRFRLFRWVDGDLRRWATKIPWNHNLLFNQTMMMLWLCSEILKDIDKPLQTFIAMWFLPKWLFSDNSSRSSVRLRHHRLTFRQRLVVGGDASKSNWISFCATKSNSQHNKLLRNSCKSIASSSLKAFPIGWLLSERNNGEVRHCKRVKNSTASGRIEKWNQNKPIETQFFEGFTIYSFVYLFLATM